MNARPQPEHSDIEALSTKICANLVYTRDSKSGGTIESMKLCGDYSSPSEAVIALARAYGVELPEEEEEESLLDLTPEERVESLTVRATPPQPNEFVCSNCHLVKHDSQLADRRRRLCRDCV